MSEICVCGHDHVTKCSGPPYEQVIGYCNAKDCRCHQFRAVLPWPNEFGWWHAGIYGSPIGLVYCDPNRNEVFSMLPWSGSHWFTQDRFQKFNLGPARFVKLIEPNPV